MVQQNEFLKQQQALMYWESEFDVLVFHQSL